MRDNNMTDNNEAPNFILINDGNTDNENEQGSRSADKLYNDSPEERLYYNSPKPLKKHSSKGTARKILLLLLIIALSAGAGFGGGLAAVHYGIGNIDVPHTGNDITINPADQVNTAEAIAAKVIPSVVGISTTTEVLQQDFFGFLSGRRLVEGVGTGIIVSENGYILTNSHVIGDGQAKTITVQLTDGREMSGTVLWNDSGLDLAVVKIDATNLTAAELGDSDDVNIGAYAAAIGNPFGLAFDRSVTQGVISGLNRTITVSDNNKPAKMEGLMQTDASINSGNSGGPLLNSKGQVIGINTAKAPAGEGLGFAIPINTAKPIIEEVMQTGTFRKAFIGISGADVELYLQYYPQDDLGTKTGVYVSEVFEASPADLAGIKVGDVIVAMDETKIETMDQLTRELFSYKPKDEVNITLYRGGQKLEVKVVLGTARNED